MPTSRASVSPGQPHSTRPSWVRPDRSAPAFWTPAMLVVVLMLVLVLLWPQRHRRPRTRAMPEPGAAYVQVDGAADLEGSFRHAPQENNGRSALLDDPESAVPRRLPDVAYIGVGAVGPWAPVPPAASANAVPDLAARSTAAPPMAGLQPRTNGIVVVFSPGLQRCGFHFDVPSAAVTGAAAVARFHVETDAAGRVMHLLSEPSENPAGARLIESAINTGRAACAGLGDVQVSWGR